MQVVETAKLLRRPPQLITLPQGKITAEDQDRITARIAKDHHIELEEARRVLDATRNFLALAASYPGNSFVPSKMVDKGWHTFLLYTRTYKIFCESLGVPFLHHEPSDGAHEVEAGGPQRTISFMKREGIDHDPIAWPEGEKAGTCDCSGCGGRD